MYVETCFNNNVMFQFMFIQAKTGSKQAIQFVIGFQIGKIYKSYSGLYIGGCSMGRNTQIEFWICMKQMRIDHLKRHMKQIEKNKME